MNGVSRPIQQTEKLAGLISRVELIVADPRGGLGDDLFLFVSRMTPIVNVDLLIKDRENKTLMTWREDKYTGPGWHLPGGILRYKESFGDRIARVAKSEIGAQVEFDANHLAINEVIHPTRSDRGHFISLLFKCKILRGPNEGSKFRHGVPKPNQWMWHDRCPENIVDVHKMYEQFINL